MSTALKVIWEDGVFKPKEPVQFEEHTERLRCSCCASRTGILTTRPAGRRWIA